MQRNRAWTSFFTKTRNPSDVALVLTVVVVRVRVVHGAEQGVVAAVDAAAVADELGVDRLAVGDVLQCVVAVAAKRGRGVRMGEHGIAAVALAHRVAGPEHLRADRTHALPFVGHAPFVMRHSPSRHASSSR